MRISKYNNISAKACMKNCSEEDFLIKTVNNYALWTYVIIDLNGEKIL